MASSKQPRRGQPEQPPEMVLTPEEVEVCLRAAAETMREAERQLERFFLLPQSAVTLRIQRPSSP